MTGRRSIVRLLPLLALALMTRAEAWACAACFGQSDSSMAQGMNMGIFTLLLVITCVLFSIAGFFVFLVRRGSRIDESQLHQIPNSLTENRTNA